MSAVPLTSKAEDHPRSSTSTGGSSSRKDQQDDDDVHDDDQYQYQYQYCCNISSSSICEIEEEGSSSSSSCDQNNNNNVPSEIKELFGNIQRCLPMPSIKEEHDSDHHHHSVYVGVGKSESSMDALTWTLKHAVNPASTIVYLIHVFPETKYIPSPLGKLPKSQVSSQQVETYMAQETGKRRELLQKFIDKCSAAKVKVDTMLIESDVIGKAIVDLIPILNITKLVVGITKSNIRKLMSRKGSGIADQILQSAPEGCEINIICEGNQVMMDQKTESPSPLANANVNANANDDDITMTKSMQQDQEQRNEAFSCMCFKPEFSK